MKTTARARLAGAARGRQKLSFDLCRSVQTTETTRDQHSSALSEVVDMKAALPSKGFGDGSAQNEEAETALGG